MVFNAVSTECISSKAVTIRLTSLVDQMLRIFPLLLSWLAFWLLYSIVPTQRVPPRDALIGALVAGALFELGKKGFALYVTMFPSYQR